MSRQDPDVGHSRPPRRRRRLGARWYTVLALAPRESEDVRPPFPSQENLLRRRSDEPLGDNPFPTVLGTSNDPFHHSPMYFIILWKMSWKCRIVLNIDIDSDHILSALSLQCHKPLSAITTAL